MALKLINVKRVEREPYQRFVREINFLRDHPTVEGLLPLVDAYLPDEPTRQDQPWLAMPIAIPIGSALKDRTLDDVVAAVAAIADTLQRLQTDHNIAHRDIKPGNLYELDGSWLIGDFGLVAFPDLPGLTASGRPLGPIHYTAYEMILEPSTADPHPADVYSLGKTLWVLSTGQRFPPEGHQPIGIPSLEINNFRPHPHANKLDQEIDLMTRLDPSERPTKSQIANDLQIWKSLTAKSLAIDISTARAKLHRKLAPAISQQHLQEEREELAHQAVRKLQELTSPLNHALTDLSDNTIIDSSTDDLTRHILMTHGTFGAPTISFRWQRCTLVAPLDTPIPMTLRMGRCLELYEDGSLVLHLMVDVGPDGVLGNNFNWRLEDVSAPVGTIEAEKMLENGISVLAEALQRGIDVLIDQLPDLNREN